MTFDDAQRAWDNMSPEDDEEPPECPDCGQHTCVCREIEDRMEES